MIGASFDRTAGVVIKDYDEGPEEWDAAEPVEEAPS